MLANWNETFRSFFKTKYKIWKTFSLNGSDLVRLLNFFFSLKKPDILKDPTYPFSFPQKSPSLL